MEILTRKEKYNKNSKDDKNKEINTSYNNNKNNRISENPIWRNSLRVIE